MTPIPCPFCGSLLAPVMNGTGKTVVTWSHPRVECWLSGYAIGASRIPLFNQRVNGPPVVEATVGYEVDQGRIFFNDNNLGSKANADFLNRVIAYYEEALKNRQ